MTIETDRDLTQMRIIGRIVALTLKEMMRRAEPGMTTAELDQVGKEMLDRQDAVSAPKITYGFPGSTCISINEEAAHGIPGSRAIRPGDVVNVDVSAERNGYFADTGGTFVVPPSSALKDTLIESTRLALSKACNQIRAGLPLNRIGKSIQTVAKNHGFKTIRNLCGHGVGRGLHEEPANITSYYEPRDKRVLRAGQVIAVEPFLSTKSRIVSEALDGWTLISGKGNLTAQFEHTLVVTRSRPILLTLT
jgi:methionyl aminopeptidase